MGHTDRLIIREFLRLPSEAMPSAQWLHEFDSAAAEGGEG